MFIIESFVSVIVAVVFCAIFIAWEVKLAKDDEFWKGLIPLGTMVLVMGLAAMLTMHIAGDQKIEYLTADLDDEMQAKMAVKTLDADIIAYGPIEIFDANGNLIDQCSITIADLEDDEMAAVRLPRYKDVFLKMTAGRNIVARFDSDKEEILDSSLLILPDDGAQILISTWAMWKSLIYLSVPMIAIYLMKRRQLRMERIRREMKKMGIEELG